MKSAVAREDCKHERLFFGSGDYYLLCHECGGKWVCSDPLIDVGAPDLANKGVGVALSGEVRAAVMKSGPQ